MAANAGVVKAIVSFYRIDSDSAFERFRSRIPINDVNTVHGLTKHLVAFLGLKELARKFGLVDFDQGLTNGTESEWGKRQLRHHRGRPVEAPTTKLVGWHRKRNEQYVF